jgi:iron complex transport system permease protein
MFRILLTLTVLNLIALLLSLSIGNEGFSAAEVQKTVEVLFGGVTYTESSLTFRSILFDIRLPRVLLALLTGGSLAVAGTAFQVLLRNVLADPYILGVSGGASVGALAAIATGISGLVGFATPLCAFIGASAVVAFVFVCGRRQGNTNDLTLLLTGVMTSSFLSAIIIGLVATIGDPVRNALFWLIGYLGNATSESMMYVSAFVLPSVSILILLAPKMNILSLGEETAQNLGLDVRRFSFIVYGLASLMTAAVVSFTGAIGFVGLIVPHISRRLYGSDHKLSLPASFLLGSLFLIVSDLIARIILAPLEIPVGAITAVLGAPVLIYIITKRK